MTRGLDHYTDSDLLEQYYNTRNNEWLGLLLQRYTLLLFGVCMKYLKNEEDARDAVQQIFLKVISDIHKHKVNHIKSWLYIVAKNHCLMKIRSENGINTTAIAEVEDIAADENGTKEKIEKDKLLLLIEEVFPQLSEEQRTCLNLFYLQKKSYQEISHETEFSLLQVKSFIQNGKRNLKLLVNKKMHSHG